MSLLLPVIILLLLLGFSRAANYFGGAHSEPDTLPASLSVDALEMIDDAYNIAGQIVDHHVHILGAGSGACSEIDNTGVYLNSRRLSPFNPVSYLKTRIFMSSSGITDICRADEQFVERLFKLAKNVPGNTQFYILALDRHWEKVTGEDGLARFEADEEKTDLYIPNSYVVKLAESLNNRLSSRRFIPVISVHPYNPNSIQILEDYHKQGINFVKWLPNTMNIDPRINDDEYKLFYRKMSALGMVLISHTGWEEALDVSSEKHQSYGFPLFLENALDAGVTVIMAHSGGDNRIGKICGKTSSESFFEMMHRASREEKWSLYGDISALTITKNIERFKEIIGNKELHNKILYGSDYPLPAVYALYPVNNLIDKGYLDKRYKAPLKEIFKYNPLVFDFVLKRNIKHPVNGKKLPEEVFLSLEDNTKKVSQSKYQV